MFKATASNLKVTTELDDKTNRLTAKISFDCLSNPDMLMELDLLRLKGKSIEVDIYTTQVEFGKKPDVPGPNEDKLWNAQDAPGAAKSLLDVGTKAPEPPKSQPQNKRGRLGKVPAGTASAKEQVSYPPEPPLH